MKIITLILHKPMPSPYSGAKTPGKPVVVLRPQDVICTRGDHNAVHPGNRQLYQVIDCYLGQYQTASGRSERAHIVHQIYASIPGNFVKRLDDDTYVVLDEKKAREKISHAIRYRLRNTADKYGIKRSSPSASLSSGPSVFSLSRLDNPFSEEIFSDDELRSVLGDQHETYWGDLDGHFPPGFFSLEDSFH